MTPEQLMHIANRWMAAFNRNDLEDLLSLYHDEARHYSPKLKMSRPETLGLIKGKAALRAWWQDSFDRLPNLRYEVIRLTPYDNRVFMEYVRRVEGEDNLVVGEMLEMKEELIVRSRVYHS